MGSQLDANEIKSHDRVVVLGDCAKKMIDKLNISMGAVIEEEMEPV